MWWDILNKSDRHHTDLKVRQRLQTRLDTIALRSFTDPKGNDLSSVYHKGGEKASPLVLNSPHSGRQYPAAFLAQTRLDVHDLRRCEDCYVDTFISTQDIAWIAAKFPRIYVDANRSPEEWPLGTADLRARAYTKITPRVQVGLGVIPTRLNPHQDIYPHTLSAALVRRRIETFYVPYHKALSEMLARARQKFGYTVLLDIHSMPSLGLDGAPRADIVLGDRFGSACTPATRAVLFDAFSDLGYNVAMNAPYAGGYITEHYGQPDTGTQAIQIEINKALYVDETTYGLTQGADKLRHDISTVIARIEDYLTSPSEIAAQ